MSFNVDSDWGSGWTNSTPLKQQQPPPPQQQQPSSTSAQHSAVTPQYQSQYPQQQQPQQQQQSSASSFNSIANLENETFSDCHSLITKNIQQLSVLFDDIKASLQSLGKKK